MLAAEAMQTATALRAASGIVPPSAPPVASPPLVPPGFHAPEPGSSWEDDARAGACNLTAYEMGVVHFDAPNFNMPGPGISPGWNGTGFPEPTYKHCTKEKAYYWEEPDGDGYGHWNSLAHDHKGRYTTLKHMCEAENPKATFPDPDATGYCSRCSGPNHTEPYCSGPTFPLKGVRPALYASSWLEVETVDESYIHAPCSPLRLMIEYLNSPYEWMTSWEGACGCKIPTGFVAFMPSTPEDVFPKRDTSVCASGKDADLSLLIADLWDLYTTNGPRADPNNDLISGMRNAVECLPEASLVAGRVNVPCISDGYDWDAYAQEKDKWYINWGDFAEQISPADKSKTGSVSRRVVQMMAGHWVPTRLLRSSARGLYNRVTDFFSSWGRPTPSKKRELTVVEKERKAPLPFLEHSLEQMAEKLIAADGSVKFPPYSPPPPNSPPAPNTTVLGGNISLGNISDTNETFSTITKEVPFPFPTNKGIGAPFGHQGLFDVLRDVALEVIQDFSDVQLNYSNIAAVCAARHQDETPFLESLEDYGTAWDVLYALWNDFADWDIRSTSTSFHTMSTSTYVTTTIITAASRVNLPNRFLQLFTVEHTMTQTIRHLFDSFMAGVTLECIEEGGWDHFSKGDCPRFDKYSFTQGFWPDMRRWLKDWFDFDTKEEDWTGLGRCGILAPGRMDIPTDVNELSFYSIFAQLWDRASTFLGDAEYARQAILCLEDANEHDPPVITVHGDPMFKKDGAGHHFALPHDGRPAALMAWRGPQGEAFELSGTSFENSGTHNAWLSSIALTMGGSEVFNVSAGNVRVQRGTMRVSVDGKVVEPPADVEGSVSRFVSKRHAATSFELAMLPDEKRIGNKRAQKLTVTSGDVRFEVYSSKAAKFETVKEQFKYRHLNIRLLSGIPRGARGMFAELAGDAPMSPETMRALLYSKAPPEVGVNATVGASAKASASALEHKRLGQQRQPSYHFQSGVLTKTSSPKPTSSAKPKTSSAKPAAERSHGAGGRSGGDGEHGHVGAAPPRPADSVETMPAMSLAAVQRYVAKLKQSEWPKYLRQLKHGATPSALQAAA